MNTDFNKDNRAANPSFRVIKSPSEKNSQAKNAISNLLAAMGSSMPQGLVSAVGGPLMAGLLAVLSCMTVIAVPAAFIGAKAMGLTASSSKKGGAQMSFSKLFGASGQTVAEGTMDADAIRAMNLATEGAHPDESTTLGLTIPEDISGKADKADEDKENEDSGGVSVTASNAAKRLDTSKKMGNWKSSFGNMPEGSGATGAAGGLTGKREIPGRQVALGDSGGGGGAVSGKTAGSSKQGVRASGMKLSNTNAGASQGLKMAANISQKLPSVQGIDAQSGMNRAAFHGAPATAKVVAGGGAGVSGGLVETNGVASVNLPENANKNTTMAKKPTPDTQDKNKDKKGAIGKAMMIALAALLAAAALAIFVVPALQKAGTTLGTIAAWVVALAGIAALFGALMSLTKAGAPGWAVLIYTGLAMAVGTALVQAAATGTSFLSSAFDSIFGSGNTTPTTPVADAGSTGVIKTAETGMMGKGTDTPITGWGGKVDIGAIGHQHGQLPPDPSIIQ